MTINDAATFWQRSIRSELDSHCPENLLLIPTRPPPLPWKTPALHQLFIKRKSADRRLVKTPTYATRISELKEGRARSQPVKHDRNFISFCLTRFAPHHDYIGNYLTIYFRNTMSLRNIPSQQLNLLQLFPP